MRQSKKGQFLIFSTLILLILLIFIYSIETDNSYIKNSAKNHILQNVVHETCMVARGLSGTELNASLYLFSSDVSSYCSEFGVTCNLTVVNNTAIPPSGDWDLLDYTHYDLSLVYNNSNLEFSQTILC